MADGMEKLMDAFEFDFEWERADGIRGTELQATWASLRITAGNECLTRVFDKAARTVRTRIFVPLHPLAEWIVWNWWSLLFEPYAHWLRAQRHYSRRHNLQFVGDGISMPNIEFRPLGKHVQVIWAPCSHPYQQIDFLGRGTTIVEHDQFLASLYSFVESVCSRLQQETVFETALMDGWEVVKEGIGDNEESAFCQAVASQGRDPYSLKQSEEEHVLCVARMIPETLYMDLFHIGSWESLSDQAAKLAEAVYWIANNSGNWKRLPLLRKDLDLPGNDIAPWDQGYILARTLRKALGCNGNRLSSLSDFVQLLDVSEEQLAQAMKPEETMNGLEAVVGENESGSPGFIIKPRSRPENQMFSFCRALCEYFVSPRSPRLVVDTTTERQKRNRAFAAEFLAPAEAIRRRLAGSETSQEEMDEIAYLMGVSSYIIAHQVENHKLAVVRDESVGW